MKPKMALKITSDIVMTIAMLLLMAHALVGQTAHEWLGAGMFLLFILHHILNFKWSKNLLKGKYTAFRVAQTVIAVSVFAVMVGLMVSGIVLSRHVFHFLQISGGRSLARTVHMLCSYWGFVLMSLHLGLHWTMMMAMARKLTKQPSRIRRIVLGCLAALIAGYGVYAFVAQDIGSYMFLKNQFVFFDFDEPLILFFLDYIAVMGLFVCIGHYLAVRLRRGDSEGV